jgi:hypothetical protein
VTESTNQPAPIASLSEAERVITHLIEVMDAMLAVVEEETRFIRAGKVSATARLIATKQELSQYYLADSQRLKASQRFLARTAPGVLEALRRRHDLFQAALQVNLTVLATAHAVSEGIMRGVSDSLARKSSPSCYGPSGRSNVPGPRHVQPLTVSRVL